MKNLIKLLAIESGITVDDDLERFSELLIRDVVDTVKRTQITNDDFEWSILNNYELDMIGD